MNKTYLNYNSVEDVPLLNSRAFQVNSSAVFRISKATSLRQLLINKQRICLGVATTKCLSTFSTSLRAMKRSLLANGIKYLQPKLKG